MSDKYGSFYTVMSSACFEGVQNRIADSAALTIYTKPATLWDIRSMDTSKRLATTQRYNVTIITACAFKCRPVGLLYPAVSINKKHHYWSILIDGREFHLSLCQGIHNLLALSNILHNTKHSNGLPILISKNVPFL